MEICAKEFCTGCGACAYICPKNCITMNEGRWGVTYPTVDSALCINCGQCQKICPSNHTFSFLGTQNAYAAWSSNPQERRTSASGGIAAEIYRYASEHDIAFFGAASNPDFSVSIRMAEEKMRYQIFKNSKYVFSDATAAYPQIKEKLGQGKRVVFIGLPCQVAAVRRLFPNADKLFLVDLVCHGVMPNAYLKQHIDFLQTRYSEKTQEMSFRDAEFGTNTFTFALYNKAGHCFYAKRTKDWDSYQVAYHKLIAYRENCYHCPYAKPERLSDLTLSDYKGLGTMAPWSGSQDKVSSVLVHTRRGAEWMQILMCEKRVIAFERPVTEAITNDAQLQHPAKKNKSRLDFEKQITAQNGDFEKAMQVVIRRRRLWEKGHCVEEWLKKAVIQAFK